MAVHPMPSRCLAPFVAAIFLRVAAAAAGEDPAATPKTLQPAGVLAPLRDLVGSWRGVGQPQRGSTRGAWVENGSWQWKFDDGGRGTLVYESPQAKVIRRAELRPTDEAGVFELRVTPPPQRPPEGATDQDAADAPQPTGYRGKLEQNARLVVTAANPPDDLPARIAIGLVAGGDRLVMLMERRSPTGDRYSRIAEVGFTREGSQFGKGNTQPECVVTGGHGSMTVEHRGKTYYVCCSGCRDLFNEDPEKVLAEYRERKAAEKEAAKN